MIKKSPSKISPAWKKDSKKYSASGISLALISLVFLILVVLVGKLIGFASDFTKSDPNIDKYYSWNGRSVINLAVKADYTYIFSFSPKDEEAIILKLPNEIYLDVPFGFGSWPVRSIYSLGEAENPPIGAKLLKQTLGGSFGIPIDGFLLSEKQDESFSDLVDDIRRNPFKFLNLVRDFKTDLTFLEKVKLWWGIKGIRSDKIESIDLEQSLLTKSLLLPDGSRGLTFDSVKLAEFSEEYFEDSLLSEEKVSIGIYNSTERSALAEKASQLITNIGGRVIFTSNTDIRLAKTQVIGKDSYTKTRLLQIFSPTCLQKVDSSCEVDLLNFKSSRADITIILGDDFLDKFKDPD